MTHVLVVLCCDSRGDVYLVRGIEGLVRLQAICVDNTSCFDFELDGSVERKVEVKSILVIGDGADRGDDQFTIAGDMDPHITEVGVLVEYTSILLATRVSATGARRHLNSKGQTDWIQMADFIVSIPPALVTKSASR